MNSIKKEVENFQEAVIFLLSSILYWIIGENDTMFPREKLIKDLNKVHNTENDVKWQLW
jgi:hypothetical protein